MIYSILVLTIGIFCGQELDLPLVKNGALYIYNLLQESKKEDVGVSVVEEIQKSIFSYFKLF